MHTARVLCSPWSLCAGACVGVRVSVHTHADLRLSARTDVCVHLLLHSARAVASHRFNSRATKHSGVSLKDVAIPRCSPSSRDRDHARSCFSAGFSCLPYRLCPIPSACCNGRVCCLPVDTPGGKSTFTATVGLERVMLPSRASVFSSVQ